MNQSDATQLERLSPGLKAISKANRDKLAVIVESAATSGQFDEIPFGDPDTLPKVAIITGDNNFFGLEGDIDRSSLEGFVTGLLSRVSGPLAYCHAPWRLSETVSLMVLCRLRVLAHICGHIRRIFILPQTGLGKL